MIMIHEQTTYSYTEPSNPVWLTGDQYRQLLATTEKEPAFLSRMLKLIRGK